MSPAKQLGAVIAIAKKYPLHEREEQQEAKNTTNNELFVPEIIISESFN